MDFIIFSRILYKQNGYYLLAICTEKNKILTHLKPIAEIDKIGALVFGLFLFTVSML